ncbi:MAG: protein kinase [Myxococcaceae bacterium]|nr:protein kinase [Myxococcaceae bacterium]
MPRHFRGPDMGELDPKIKIRAPLRCDGIGRLDCAEHLDSGSRLAVRWLPLEANGDAAVKACEKLPVHPTLPRIHQTGSVGTSAFVAMDFPEGQVLSALVEDRLDIDIVIRIASQLSDALATVHDQGVVHGEISTESVLLVPPDRAYLWDMPLVIANRMTDRRGENRLMQNLPRTAAYLAPERAKGSGASMSGDVYALGTVLCAIAGAPLPTAQTTLGVVHLVASGEWTPRVPSTIPDPWHSMLVRMVSSDPSQRPSAREVATAFAKPPAPAMLPTVPEMPAVRLPPELMAAAEALARKPALDTATEPGASAAADAAVVAEVKPETPAAPSETVVVAAHVPTVAEAQKADAPAAVTSESVSVPVQAPPRTDSQEVPEVAATDVVKLPTIEMPMVQMQDLVNKTQVSQASSAVTDVVVPPAPRMTPLSTTAVPLTDSIMVSPELANAGAVTLTPEQLAQLQRPAKWVYVVGGAMAAAIVVLMAVAVHLALRQHEAATQAVELQRVAVPAQAPRAPTPVKAVNDDDELAPIAPVRATAKKSSTKTEEQGFDMPERNNLAGRTEL